METIDDIVRKMRTLGRLDEKSTDKIPRSLQALGLRIYADRIEAAYKRLAIPTPEQWTEIARQGAEIADLKRENDALKRELEAGAEAGQICGEIGEMIGREAACKEEVEDCNRLGNAAAMREACANIAEYAKTAACHTEDAHLLGYLNQIERWAEAALSVQPRNCDMLSDAQKAFSAIRDIRCYVNNPIEERRLTVNWLFAKAKGATDGSKKCQGDTRGVE